MARRRGRDRVVGVPSTGGSSWFDPSVSLPRGSYRDFEALSGTFAPDAAVYRRLLHRGVPRLVVARPVRRERGGWFANSPLPTGRLRGGIRASWRPTLDELPSRVRFCVQRKQRREVLFAKERAGFSGSAKKSSWRRSSTSQYGC